ncbi:hypothetical protein BDZ89DRAFT_993849 [Hymenopellis radicata]|nr:hypothetical protein BDZ89DRAFT_993849 [Hymenopellis radicata]
MLQELTHMDRITQLQDEIQQLLLIMARSIEYLTSKANFLQVSPQIPVTKTRAADKLDTAEETKKELVTDLVMKAKQVEFLIQSLPVPEPEAEQAKRLEALELEMAEANTAYIQALDRTKKLHQQVSLLLRTLLMDNDSDLVKMNVPSE